MTTKREFPPIPPFRAKWAPIYIEPIMASGERITIGIMTIPSKGEPIIVPVLSEAQVVCAFGESGLSLLDTAQLCLDDLNEHLQNGDASAPWIPPLSGVTIGDERLAAGSTIDDIVQMAMRSSAAFSATTLRGGIALGDQVRELDEWEKKIKEGVSQRAPRLQNNFSQGYSIIEGISDIKFDYLGSRYVANFGKVGHPISEINAKAKLLNLTSLHKVQPFAFGEDTPTLELILLRPTAEGNGIQEKRMRRAEEAILELAEICRRNELKAFPVGDAEEASVHIVEMEVPY